MNKSFIIILLAMALFQKIYSMEYGKFPQEKKNIENLPLLHRAILKNDNATVFCLLREYPEDYCVSANFEVNGITPLLLAVNFDYKKNEMNEENDEILKQKIERQNYSIVEQLIKHNADVNAWYKIGYKELINPLQLAALRGNNALIKLLIANGARINEVNSDGYSALHYAAREGHGASVRELLLAHSSRILLTDITNKMLPLKFLAHELALHNKHTDIASLIVNWCSKIKGTLLHEALFETKITASSIVKIIELTIDIDRKTDNKVSPIHFAIKYGNLGIIQLLLDKNASVNCLTPLKESSLSLAILYSQYQIAELLLRNGAKIEDFHLLIHTTCRNNTPDIAELLVSYEASVNQQDLSGKTPLHICLKKGLWEIAKILCSSGKVDPNISDFNGNYPLHKACKKNHYDFINLLLECGAQNLPDKKEKTPFWYIDHTNTLLVNLLIKQFGISKEYFIKAIEVKRWDKILECLDAGLTEEVLPSFHPGLLFAAFRDKKNDQLITSLLVDYKVKCDRRNPWTGFTALHYAVVNSKKEIVKLLLKLNNEMINQADCYFQTPLFYLQEAEEVTTEIFELLITHGAALDHFNNEGLTPLLYYCKQNRLSIAKLFVQLLDCDINLVSNDTFQTALHFACSHGGSELIQLLIENGAIYAPNSSGDYPLDYVQPNDTASLNALKTSTNENKRTLLHSVLSRGIMFFPIGNFEKILNLADKSNCAIQDKFGNTPLHTAIKFYHYNEALALIKYSNLELENDQRETVLYCACMANKLFLVESLLQQGALIDTSGSGRESLLCIAMNQNNLEMATLLLRHGAFINHKAYRRETILHFACFCDDICKVRFLLEQPEIEVNIFNDLGESPLYQTGNVEIIELLLAHSAFIFPNYQGRYHSRIDQEKINELIKKYPPAKELCSSTSAIMSDEIKEWQELMWPYVWQLIVLDKNCSHETLKKIDYLFKLGVPVNYQSERRTPLLHQAVINNDSELIRVLSHYNLNLELENFWGERPLHLACAWGNHKIVEELLRNGVNPDCEDKLGTTPLERAIADKDNLACFSHLLHYQVDTTIKIGNLSLLQYLCKQGNVQAAALLLKAPQYNSTEDQRSFPSPLEYACISGNVQLVELLIKYDFLSLQFNNTIFDLIPAENRKEIIVLLRKKIANFFSKYE